MRARPALLDGKLALVTGGSGTIGVSIAQRLALDGASVLVHYNSNGDEAESVTRAIVESGGSAESVAADLGASDGPTSLIAKLDDAFGGRFRGRLDILVNNAGTFGFDGLTNIDDETFDYVFRVNVRAPFQLAREASRRMMPVGWGRIVNMGSVFGEATPSAGMSTYCGSKFAIAGLTRAWSRDLGGFGITVNAVQPALIVGYPLPTDGPMVSAKERFVSVGRFGRGDDVADAVAYFVDPRSSFVNGVCLNIDGGWSA